MWIVSHSVAGFKKHKYIIIIVITNFDNFSSYWIKTILTTFNLEDIIEFEKR